MKQERIFLLELKGWKGKRSKNRNQAKRQVQTHLNMIHTIQNKLTLCHLFELSGVLKSGYYGFIKQTDSKLIREMNDEEDFERLSL